MKTGVFLTFILILSGAAFDKPCHAQGSIPCPHCYKNQTPLAGHGTTSAQDGSRRRLTVFIDSSLTSGNVPAGLTRAMDSWNGAVDSTTNPPQKTKFFFERTTDRTKADFILVAGNPDGGCIDTTLSEYPHVIRISSTLANLDPFWIGLAIAHDFGHRLGLDDETGDLECGGAASVMQGQHNCKSVNTLGVGPNDVHQSNRNFDSNTRSQCTNTAPATAGDADEGGGDPCAGDPCCADPCCGDPCCGDPCCGDPCCGDPCCGDPCCGNPNCGQECYEVCMQDCWDCCTVYDDYGECYWTELCCDGPTCEMQCY